MTGTTGLQKLADTLAVETEQIAALEAYDDAQLVELDRLITDAMAAEEKAFDEALEESLRFVPRLLRGVARSMVFSGGEK